MHGYSGDGVVEVSDMSESDVIYPNLANGVMFQAISLDVTPFVQSLVNDAAAYCSVSMSRDILLVWR